MGYYCVGKLGLERGASDATNPAADWRHLHLHRQKLVAAARQDQARLQGNPMMHTLTPCLGIPVYYDPKLKNISDSRGIWRWKKIVVGPAFLQLSEREAGAVLLHEAGHCKLRHLEKRLTMAWLVLVSPQRLLRICLDQEFEADRFAAECGYGTDLVRLFRKMDHAAGTFHPELSTRIARLTE